MKPHIGVVYFPGNNCEEESVDAIKSAGMDATLVRWNEDPGKLSVFDGYLLPGGWAYEDRVRAGAIAAKAKIVQVLKAEAKKGKPVIGICNGFQVLCESGLLPVDSDEVKFALAPNKNPFIAGYYCSWVRLTVSTDKENAFNKFLTKGQVVQIPIAHGEGRFTTKDESLIPSLQENGQVLFQYCDEEGKVATGFPADPNGAVMAIAGITNKEGNVLGMMPHPERANYRRQVPGCLTQHEEAGPGRAIFLSMKAYIEGRS